LEATVIGDQWEMCHVAIAVDDLDRAMAHYASTVGVSFTEVLSFADMPLTRPDGGPLHTDIRVAWTVGNEPPLELMQGPAGSIWEVASGEHRIHHVAFWVDDLERESRLLEEGGMRLQLTLEPGRPPKGMAYHVAPSGFRIELMRTEDRPAVDRWRNGEPLELEW
jgi:catechol 2,3-dioxygenase-like lactoylglutathione lyase family enzyme